MKKTQVAAGTGPEQGMLGLLADFEAGFHKL